MRRIVFAWWLAFIVLLAAEPALAAVTVYVHGGCSNNSTTYNPAGSGACTGGSDRVFSGIQNAHDWASLAPGDIIDVRAGTYSEDLSFTKSGSAGNPITLRGHTGETITTGRFGFIWEPIVHHWNVDNIVFNGTLTGSNSAVNAVFLAQLYDSNFTNVTVRNGPRMCLQGWGPNNLFRDVTIEDCGLAGVNHDDYGVYWLGADTIFERVTLRRARGYCFHIFDSGSNSVARNKVRFSTIGPDCGLRSGEGGAAIIISTGPANEVYGNLIYGNNAAVQVDYRCHDCKVFNNTIYNNAGPGIAVGANNDSTGVLIKNNILRSNGSNGASVLGGTGHVLSNQHCDSPATGCITTGNPLFADAPNNDFRLCTGAGTPHASCTGASPAIDQGATLGPPWNVDIKGTARPQGNTYDIGAHESGGSGPLPPPVGECPAQALVAQYGFDGAATDSSGFGNHATLGSGVTYVAGKYGQGVRFPGTAGVTAPHSSSLHLPCGSTFEGWVQLPSGLTDFATFLASNYGTTLDGWFFYLGSSGYAQAGAPIGGYCIGDCTTNAIAVYGVNLTTSMTHVALTRDHTLGSANIKMWINGVNVTSANGAAILADWTGNLCIGCSPFGEYLPNLSVVDEVRIYNYPRTGAQIAADMNTPIGAPTVPVGVRVSGNTIFKAGPGVEFKFGLVP